MKYTALEPKILDIQVAFSPLVDTLTPKSAALMTIHPEPPNAAIPAEPKTHGARGGGIQDMRACPCPASGYSGFRKVPAIVEAGRHNRDFRRDCCDECGAGRSQATVVRYDDSIDLSEGKILHNLALGLGLDIPGQQHTVLAGLNQDDTG